MTLRSRLRIVAGLLLAVVAVVGFLLTRSVEGSQLQQIDQQLQAAIPVALTLGRPPAGLLPRNHPPTATSAAFSDLYVAAITDARRSVLFTPTVAGGEAPRLPTAVTELDVNSDLNDSNLRTETVNSVSGSGRWRATLIQRGTSTRVLLAVYLSQADATATRLKLAVIAAAAAVLLVLVAAGLWVARLGLRPIAEVTDVADAIASGDRSRRVGAASSGTEAAHLARAFNVMLDEQQALEDRLRQFVADASHELRTPAAAIQGLAELWRHGHLRDGQVLDDAMRRIGQESVRLSGLVEDLLLLARLDEGVVLHVDPVDVVALAREVLFEASESHPSRELVCEADGPVVAFGDRVKLRQVVSNLVVNALVHTDPDASVRVRVSACDDMAVIEVIDTGNGMVEQEATHAFDRFWRADASRSRAGSGLGLPIVAAIVAAHSGEVVLQTEKGAGTTIKIVLPGESGNILDKKAPGDA
jgi:two-component system OmpR family sensor kinase